MYKEFLNVANEEKFTILGGKLPNVYNTFAEKFFRVLVRQ